MPAIAKSAVEIHNRLAQGEPDDVIARAVRRKPRMIRNHRAGHCVCVDRPTPETVTPVDRPPPETVTPETVTPIDVGDPTAVATAAYLAGLSPLAIAVALGVDAYSLSPDALDFGLTGLDISRRRLERLAAQADALERTRVFRPSQWVKLVGQEAESERKMSLDSRLPLEIWTGFFSELVHHQAGILTDDDFQRWREWVQDLVTSRYPGMAGT